MPRTDGGGLVWSSMVMVGQVARSHGRRGEVVVNPATDFLEERFREGATVYVEQPAAGAVALRIVGARVQRGRPVLALEGIETLAEARSLAGLELRIPQSEQRPLPDGVYYTRALVGCEVHTVDGHRVGTVVDVQEAGGASRLVVEDPVSGAEVDIPLVDPICPHIDTAAKRVVIDPPGGLLELNRRS